MIDLKDINGTVIAKSKIVALFGQYFIALDWSQEAGRLLIFETYKGDNSPKSIVKFDAIAASSGNENLILYSSEHHSLVHVYRDRHREVDHVMEDWIDIDF